MSMSDDSESYSEPDAVLIDRDAVSDYNPDNILPKSPQDLEKIREWLQPTSYAIAGGEFRKHLASHAQGTGQWLTSTTEYQQWRHGEEHGLLWIKGIPGSGKSVYAAKLVDDLSNENPGCPVLFFFFRQIITANHSPQALLRDWMDQVLKYSPPLQHRLWGHIQDDVSLASISLGDLLNDLKMAFRALPDKVFCVADALDEMDTGNDASLQAIASLGKWMPQKVKVLITSRPVATVEMPLRQIPALHIRLEESFVDVDISTYVQSMLSESQIPRDQWTIIANTVPGRANGLFLYAKLAMDSFLESGVNIKTALAKLPVDLNALYTDLLTEHAKRSGVSPSVQHLILQSVTHATRPLRLLELAEMCRIVDPDHVGRDLKAAKGLIRIACGSLLEILPDETVSVVHHSFTEYLKGTTRSGHEGESEGEGEGGHPVLRQGPCHARLAVSCLRYLLATRCLDHVKVDIDDSDETPCVNDEQCVGSSLIPHHIPELQMKYPFYVYAVHNWPAHIRASEAVGHRADEIGEVLQQFLGEDQTVKAWLQVTWLGYEQNARKFSTLHLSARYGLRAYTMKLVLERPNNIDTCDIAGKTPLWWAAFEGHAAVVSELIASSADPDHAGSRNRRRPLQEAAKQNHYAVVQVLLNAGVPPLEPRSSNSRQQERPALVDACEAGHVETVDAFLPFLNLDQMHQALSWAAQAGQSRVIARVLSHPGVEVDTMVRGTTALFKACSRRDLASMKALLEAGADPHLLNDDWDEKSISSSTRLGVDEDDEPCPRLTCLHALCGAPNSVRHHARGWDEPEIQDMATLLIQAGADVNRRTRHGTTALHHAVQWSFHLTRLLLESGASVHAADRYGRTPLHLCHLENCISCLVQQYGADVDAKDNGGNTALVKALANGHDYKVLALLENEADAGVINSDGENVLHLALQSSAKPHIVQAILDRGVDLESRNRKGETALMCLIKNDARPDTYALLLSAGADINARDRAGRTIFFQSVSRLFYTAESEKVLQSLINHGASPHERDFKGRTCFHEIIAEQPWGNDGKTTLLLDILLDLGLDPTGLDHDGNSLLHELAARESTDISDRPWVVPLWERLVCSLGLDADHQNHQGRTPLHVLCDVHLEKPSRYKDRQQPIDFILSHTKNVNIPDYGGTTALHIASSRTEHCTKKLLDAGADPRVVTHKGLTPCHFAARAQHSNIVGMLVSSLRKKRHEHKPHLDPKPTRLDGDDADADAEDANGLTPLYYAVRSGRPESVMILLRAGAVVRQNLFKACTEFEDENTRCNAARHINNSAVGADTDFEAASRHPDVSRDEGLKHKLSTHETNRLEEIVSLLVTQSNNGSQTEDDKPFDAQLVVDCIIRGRAYTARCLLDRWLVDRSGASVCERFLGVSGSAYESSLSSSESFERIVAGKRDLQLFFLVFMRQRQYHLVRELAKRGTSFLPDLQKRNYLSRSRSNFGTLVQHGFTLLVESIGEIEAERAFGKGDWHAFGDSSKPGLWCARRPSSKAEEEGRTSPKSDPEVEKLPTPFLFDAVRRDLPNFGVVRSLVESFHVDVNERVWGRDFLSEKSFIHVDSALHYVAKGLHWWHVHQALKYLLKLPGVDVNLRIKGGLTPLHGAIRHQTGFTLGPYSHDAVNQLLKAGADVNAVTNAGESCLSMAKRDTKLTRLLLEYGANISTGDIVSAIEEGCVDVLRELLCSVGDTSSIPETETQEDVTTTVSEEPSSLDLNLDMALFEAGMLLRKRRTQEDFDIPEVDREISIEMIEMLLSRGAKPLARFTIREKYDSGRGRTIRQTRFNPDSPWPDLDSDEEDSREEWEARETTVLHELILNVDDFPIRMFLKPGLDINSRGPFGMTLLHVACLRDDFLHRAWDPSESTVEGDDGEQGETAFQLLIALGADLHARDDLGQTVLMCLLKNCSWRNSPAWMKTLEATLRLIPDLVNEADLKGDTALMYAVRGATQGLADVGIVKRLLRVGASPLPRNKHGETVLHLLAKDIATPDLRDLLQDLVTRGADINARNFLGETPLFMFALRYKQDRNDLWEWDASKRERMGTAYEEPREKGAVALLRELGADFFARDDKGRGLLHAAATMDAVRFQELMAVGLDPAMEDHSHQTAIDVAAAHSNYDILKLFKKKKMVGR